MCFFNQYFQQNKIQRQVKHAYHEVAEQLDPAFHGGIAEHNILRHKETNRKSNAERSKQRGAVCLECIKVKMKFFALKYIFIADKIYQEPEQRIGSARSGIPECLLGHDLPKRRIEKINDWQQQIPGTMYMSAHGGAKIYIRLAAPSGLMDSVS